MAPEMRGMFEQAMTACAGRLDALDDQVGLDLLNVLRREAAATDCESWLGIVLAYLLLSRASGVGELFAHNVSAVLQPSMVGALAGVDLAAELEKGGGKAKSRRRTRP